MIRKTIKTVIGLCGIILLLSPVISRAYASSEAVKLKNVKKMVSSVKYYDGKRMRNASIKKRVSISVKKKGSKPKYILISLKKKKAKVRSMNKKLISVRPINSKKYRCTLKKGKNINALIKVYCPGYTTMVIRVRQR